MTRSDDLHFKTGRMGRLAQFFVRLRAIGDLYDETLVLPALIVLGSMSLNNSGKLAAWTVFATILGTAIIAGAWLGAALGFPGTCRAPLRGITVGAIEAGAYALVYRATFSVNLILVNFYMFYISSMFASTMSDFVLVTEEDWQKAGASRAFAHKVIRVLLRAEPWRGQPTGVALTVWIIIYVLLPVFVWKILGIKPGVILHLG